MDLVLIAVAAAVFVYVLVSRRLSRTALTAPMLFLILGFVLADRAMAHGAEPALHLLAEATLVVVLFSDASRIDARAVVRHHLWPLRMLLLGLPLAILFGWLAGIVLLPGWGWWEIATVAAILAPTDAALGQAVISDKRVPDRVRRTLNIESGLNDGLALPAILFLSCIAVGGNHDFGQVSWVHFVLMQIGYGVAIGLAVGFAGGWLLRHADAAGLAEPALEGVAVLALAGACYVLAESVHGNGFVAAFLGGLAFGIPTRGRCHQVAEFLEGEGQLLILASFLLIGAVLLPEGLGHVPWGGVVLVLLSLVLLRPAAIWLSLVGSDAPPSSRLFMGWFGPRGLATALFALVVIDLSPLPHAEEVLGIAVTAVLLSAVLHGATAAPAAGRLGRRLTVDLGGQPSDA